MNEVFVSFTKNAHDEMKKSGKDIFWSLDLVASLFSDVDPRFDKFFPQDTNLVRVLNITGPVREGFYELEVEGGVVCDEDQRITTPVIILALKVEFSVSEICDYMRSNPDDTVTDKQNQITLHNSQAMVFRKNLLNLNFENSSYVKPDYIYDLPISEYGFWTEVVTGKILEEIEKKITSDLIGGEFSIHFPADTNRLTLVDIRKNPRHVNAKFNSYIFNVIPFKEDTSDPEVTTHEQLSRDPIYVVINVPKAVLFRAIEKNELDNTLGNVLPEMRIVNVYTTAKYKQKVVAKPATPASAPSTSSMMWQFAASMMSALRGEQPVPKLDTFSDHQPIPNKQLENEVEIREGKQETTVQLR